MSDLRLTVPEVARRLGIEGSAVYELIFAGDLKGGPHSDGAVYVTEAAVVEFERQRQSAPRPFHVGGG